MRRETFERYVKEAVDGLPTELKSALKNIDIVIEERTPSSVLREMGPVLGLYEGTPLPERELGETYLPDKISIFRQEILGLGLTGSELVDEIRTTVLHELGHYFGLEDDAMHEWGY